MGSKDIKYLGTNLTKAMQNIHTQYKVLLEKKFLNLNYVPCLWIGRLSIVLYSYQINL